MLEMYQISIVIPHLMFLIKKTPLEVLFSWFFTCYQQVFLIKFYGTLWQFLKRQPKAIIDIYYISVDLSGKSSSLTKIVDSQTPWLECRIEKPGRGVKMYLYIYIRFKW